MRPLLIVNPSAAGSRTGRRTERLGREVRVALGPTDMVKTEYRGHARELAREAASAGRELLVSVGGDGTLNEVVNGVLEACNGHADGVTIGFVPQGTGGDFRRSLGFKSTDECLHALASGRTRRLDVGRLQYTEADGRPGTRFFVNIVSAGMGGLVDRYVVEAPRHIGPHLAYYVATLRALAEAPLAALQCRITDESGGVHEREITSRVFAVCNGAYFGSGMKMAPSARMDDGRLEVTTIGTRTRAELLLKSPTVYSGTHLVWKAVAGFSCRRIEVALDGTPPDRFPLDVDGEPLGYPPFAVDVVPGALLLRA